MKLASTFLTAGALALLFTTTSVTAYKNRIFMLRHGEKPADGSVGLSSTGQSRAQCLRNVFTAAKGYNVKYILTQDYKSDGSRKRPYDTMVPLAQDLGLTIDHKCDRDDPDCVHDKVKAFADARPASEDVLICWEHDALSDIADKLCDGGCDFQYPSSRFDLVYLEVDKVLSSNSPFSEHCPGLDA